jgi:hypothetical protein
MQVSVQIHVDRLLLARLLRNSHLAVIVSKASFPIGITQGVMTANIQRAGLPKLESLPTKTPHGQTPLHHTPPALYLKNMTCQQQYEACALPLS